MAATENNGTWLTQDAYDRLKEELDHLSGPYRQEIVERIAAARDEGDLRENGGYHAARDEQGKNEARIKQLTHLLENANVGEAPSDDGVVALGMVIEAEIAGRPMKFLLGSREVESTLPEGSDLKVFSEKSPMGAAILGHKQGEEVTYQAPNGNDLVAKIISVTPFQG